MKRLLLSLFVLIPCMVYAEVYSGVAGDCKWSLNTVTGVLTINGKGEMGSTLPTWLKYRYSIKCVLLENGVTSIGEEAFDDCSSLTSVTIPNSVTSIGKYAFRGCSSLTSVTIPNSVTSIGGYAFGECSSLTSVTIPNSVTSIGDCAFRGCSSLTSVAIPNSVTEIGVFAFYTCVNLETVISYSKNPPYLSSKTFPLNCKLYIPDGTRSIYSSANWDTYSFEGGIYEFNALFEPSEHYYLRNVSTNLFWGAGCSWGTQASLVDEYQYVLLKWDVNGKYLMETIVSNGEGLNFFGNPGINDPNLFMDTSGTHVNIVKSGDYFLFSIKEGQYIGYDGSSSELVSNLSANDKGALWIIMTEEDVLEEQKNILSSATTYNPVDATFLIKDAGFGRNRRDMYYAWTMVAENQNLGGGVDASHYNGCAESWHSVFSLSQTIENLPAGRYKFSAQGFYRQEGDDNQNLPYFYMNDEKSVFNQIGGTENNMWDAGISFQNGLYEVEPMYVEIGDNGTLTIGAKLENNLNLWCIWDNFRLTYYGNILNGDISFTSPTEVVKKNAAYDVSLQMNPIINVPGYTKEDLDWTSSNEDVATVNDKGLVTGRQFGTTTITCRLKNLSASCDVIFYSDNLIYIGNIFYKLDGESAIVTNCAGGEPFNENERYEYGGTVNIPENITYDGKRYTVTQIGEYAFFNMKNLQAVVIPKTVVSLNYRSFEKSPNLARVVFTNTQGNLQTIGERAFYECPKINNVVMPNSVTRVDRSAFQYCNTLGSVTLSSSLNFINEYAFANCPVLNNIDLPESLKSIQIGAFSEDASLSSITFPAGLEGIGAAAFNNCKALKTVSFETNHYTMTIGNNAFSGCNAVNKVNIVDIGSWVSTYFSNPSANPASISHHIYKDNVELKDVVIPEGPIYINNNVFYGCQYITSLTIPNSIQVINDNIFYGCTSLKSVKSSNSTPATFIGVENPNNMQNVFNAATLYVPENAINVYKSSDWWKLFGKISVYELPSSIEIISDEALINKNIFDIKGHKVNNLIKGQIYIVNGKKILVK